MTVSNKQNNKTKLSTFLNRFLIVVFVLFVFNFNYDAFNAGAAVTVTGTGTPGFIAKWVDPGSTPTAPVITGPNSGNTNIVYSYGFTASDSGGDQIRYGVDWNMDGTADEWLPNAGYVNSGQQQSTNHSWASAGTQNFQALAQNSTWGANSAWTGYSVAITVPVVNGVCGTANKNYPGGSSSYGGDTFCALGTASPASPVFPTPATPTNWTCVGTGIGHTDASCQATVSVSTFSLTIGTNVKPTGGSVKSTSDANVINCGATCSGTYANNSVVTLQATPDSSYWKFSSWSGGCSGSSTTCNVTITAPTTVTATFVPRPYNYIEF